MVHEQGDELHKSSAVTAVRGHDDSTAGGSAGVDDGAAGGSAAVDDGVASSLDDEAYRPPTPLFSAEMAAVNYQALLAASEYGSLAKAGLPKGTALLRRLSSAPLPSLLGKRSTIDQERATECYEAACHSFLVGKTMTDAVVLLRSARNYPRRVRTQSSPPLVLYGAGHLDLLDRPAVAIVGTREPSNWGRRQAKIATRLLVQAGFVVVSGLARGIDGEVHRAACQAEGRQIAILATPLDQTTPRRHEGLQRRLAQEQLVVSQFGFGHPVWRSNFPRRDRLMAHLTVATVVIEAGDDSGSLITARKALAAGRQAIVLRGGCRGSWLPDLLVEGASALGHVDELAEVGPRLLTSFARMEAAAKKATSGQPGETQGGPKRHRRGNKDFSAEQGRLPL